MTLLSKLITSMIVITLTACGGGGKEPTAPPTPALDTNVPPTPAQMAGPSFTTDVERMRAGRNEAWKQGDAREPTEIPKHMLAVDPRAGTRSALAVDPVQRPMGATVPVAPIPTTIPTDAGTKGMWSQVYNWPLIPIHLSMMPDGRLMSYGSTASGTQTGFTIYDIFDPLQGLFNGHMTVANNTGTDIFCSVQLYLPNSNQLLTIGGDNYSASAGSSLNTGNNNSTLFTPADNTLVRGLNMNRPRWYGSGLTLLDGRTFVMGGLGGADRPEVRSLTGQFTLLSGADTSRLDYWYPRLWNNYDGRIFGYDSYGNYYYLNPAGNGTLQIINQWEVNRFGETGSAVMYRPGKIAQFGGYSAMMSLIDIRGTTPVMTPNGLMPSGRRQTHTSSLLPNGKILITGGSDTYNTLADAKKTADIWDPDTNTWVVGPQGNLARLYHSVGLLMPDGTVLVGGGGAWGPLNNTNVEFYYPPYLFNVNGTLTARPLVSVAPQTMELGKSVQLTVDDSASSPITRVTMVKMGAVTHDLNSEQNFNELPFTRNGNTITATVPSKGYDATPGYYMIFVLTAAGTPSQARIVKLDLAGAAPNAPTALTGSYTTGTGVKLDWTQSSSAGITQNIIARGVAAAGPFTNIATIAANTTYTDPVSTTGTYYYVVKAVSSGGTSGNSNTAAVFVGTPTAPSAPTGVTGSFVSGSGVNLSWTNPIASPAVSGIIVYRGTAVAGPYTSIASLGPVSSYLDPLQTVGTYYYQVIASNSVGPGPAGTSNAVTISSAPPPTLNAPTGLSGYACGTGCWTTDTGVHFNWTKSTSIAANQYIVQRNTIGRLDTAPWTTIATLGNIGTYTDKNVTSGVTYYYRVQAAGGGNTSPFATLNYGITSNITLSTGGGSPQATIGQSPTQATAGQTVLLTSSGSTVPAGRTISSYAWTLTNGGGIVTSLSGATTATASATPSAAGSFSVSLLITDSTGATSTASATIMIAAAQTGGTFGLVSQEQTKYLVMNWWRGDPATEGANRQPGICNGVPPTGNCTLGARKTFRPMAFNIATTPAAVAGLIVMDVPQFESGVKTYDHYRLPVEFIKTACTFKIRHVRTHGSLEFPLNPPGLEILDHQFTLTQALCDSYPTGAMTQAWLNTLNTALDAYLGPKVTYNPIAYPYNDPRTGKDPSQP